MGLALILAACAEQAYTRDQVIASGWLVSASTPQPPEAIYCYETIGVVDCHAEPLTDAGNRFVGFHGPPAAPNP